jgi:hypothetical protein
MCEMLKSSTKLSSLKSDLASRKVAKPQSRFEKFLQQLVPLSLSLSFFAPSRLCLPAAGTA